jgi:hypothetical protein
MDFRRTSLILAEAFDAWRVVPRLIVIGYAWLVVQLYLWWKTIPSYVKESCDSKVLEVLLKNKISLEEATEIACTVTDVVGGPTTAQSAFVTTIVGLSAGIFGLYTSTGRKWSEWTPPDTVKTEPKEPS